MARRPTANGIDLLRRVGGAVRHWRSRRGLSRRALEEASGVSTRFLAQLEAGTGNISLRRLDDLARALEVPVVQLLEGPREADARRVALVGLRGAGKSTIGPLLAERLGLPFLELDALIEEAAGLPMPQIFEIHGESYFRRLERETLRRHLGEPAAAVLATGGGLVTEPETYALLRERCRTVWLAAAPEDHYHRVLDQGDERPMAGNPHAMAELRALLDARRPLYAQAGLTVDTSSLSVREAVETITRTLPETG
jgi:XRE family transcriptional regulator, aerobic/anaerobic benzoate catabolism transcriptional regulator